MRSICKKGSATLMAVIALCAISAASASASQWYVGGKAMTAATKLAETAKVEETITFSVPGLATKITCSSLTLKTPELLTTGVLKTKFETEFGGCKLVEGFKKCTIEEGRGETRGALEGTPLLGTAPEDQLETKASGGEFVVFPTEGCEYAEIGFARDVPFSMPTGQTESVEQTFVGEGTKAKALNHLELFGNNVYVTGKFKLKLASGAKWSFH